MFFLSLLPVILSLLLMTAHALHSGLWWLLPVLVAALLLFVRHQYAARLIQLILLAFCVEWLRSIVQYIGEYQQEGKPWMRMAIILGSVTAFTLASAFVFFLTPLRQRYATALSEASTPPDPRPPQSA